MAVGFSVSMRAVLIMEIISMQVVYTAAIWKLPPDDPACRKTLSVTHG